MATALLSADELSVTASRKAGLTVQKTPKDSRLGPSLGHELAYLGRLLMGVLLLLFGGALSMTLWLMPVGLPCAFAWISFGHGAARLLK